MQNSVRCFERFSDISVMKHNIHKRYSPVPNFYDKDRTYNKVRNYKGRSFKLNIMAALVWPFLFAAEDVFTFPKRRAITGFVLFCAFVGLTYIPEFGSDGYVFKSMFSTAQDEDVFKEPIIQFLTNIAIYSGFGYHFFFMLLGLIYATFVSLSAHLFFKNLPVNQIFSTAAVVFLLAFFLNHPVFDALNARYQLSIWVLLFSTILMLKGRWQLSLCICFLGTMIHFGHSIFSLALVLLLLSRKLGKMQIVFAYVMLVSAFFMPSTLMLSLGDSVAQKLGGSFAEKVNNTANLAAIKEASIRDRSSGGSTWYIVWFAFPIFYSLLLSGHLLWWKIRKHFTDPQYQLWILVIIMWSLQIAMRGEPEAAGRVERNTLALLLMWHARWFLYRRSGEFVALLFNVAPMIFYFVISFRRALNDVRIGAFLPSFYSYFTYYMPTVEQFFKRFH